MAKFDLAKTDALMHLFETPRDARDAAWRASFYDAIGDASLASIPDPIMRGPDGFPYFVLKRPPVGEEFKPFCLADILEDVTTRGVGVVVDPKDAGPEWVFTYGDLFSLRAYGTFDGDPQDHETPAKPAVEVVEKDRELPVPTGTDNGEGSVRVAAKAASVEVMIGAPSEEMLPSWARQVIAAFLKSAVQLEEPRVLVMVEPSPLVRNLVFNIHPEEFPSHAEFERLLHALSWFLPRGRSVIAVSAASDLAAAFVPLV